MNSYKVGVKTPGDQNWASNALRFATREEAELYARDLFARWLAVKEWTVLESEDRPNYRIVDGVMSEIKEGV